MADFGPFGAILGDLNDKNLQMTPFSLSTLYDLSDGTVKFRFENFLKILFTGICTDKWRHLKMVQKGSKTFPIDCAFFLVVLGPQRDLCVKFQSHTIFFTVRAFFELILPDYRPQVAKNTLNTNLSSKILDFGRVFHIFERSSISRLSNTVDMIKNLSLETPDICPKTKYKLPFEAIHIQCVFLDQPVEITSRNHNNKHSVNPLYKGE